MGYLIIKVKPYDETHCNTSCKYFSGKIGVRCFIDGGTLELNYDKTVGLPLRSALCKTYYFNNKK